MKVGKVMKSSLGRTLRKIREGKNISLCSISDEYLSKSQISRFERGESEISCIRLINILDKLHVSLDEFMIIHENYNTLHSMNSFDNIIQYIQKEYASQNLDNLKKLLCNTSKYNLNEYDKTMIKSIIYTIDENFGPTKEEITNLTNYLFEIENWGYYEIILLGNCVRTVPYELYFTLTKEMIRNYIYSSMNKTNKRLVAQLAINCFILSVDENKFSNCIYLSNEINKLLDNELIYYEKTIFLYARGYFEFKMNSIDGVKKMQNAIQIFDFLGEHKIKMHYAEHYNKIINK